MESTGCRAGAGLGVVDEQQSNLRSGYIKVANIVSQINSYAYNRGITKWGYRIGKL
jgi:hypothetical protein